MVSFNHQYKAGNKGLAIDYLFYLSSILLAVVVFSYLIFNFKIRLQSEAVQDIEKKILGLNTEERQAYDKKIIDYRKKINDFAEILNSHRIASSIFSFLEEKTMGNIWFSNFDMQESDSGIKLSGETENMESLSRQIEVFENSKDYVRGVNVLNSQANSGGKISFLLSISFDPKVFDYIK